MEMATNRSLFLCGCIHLIRPSNCFDILYKSRISGKVSFYGEIITVITDLGSIVTSAKKRICQKRILLEKNREKNQKKD